MPYIALQLVGIQAVLEVMGVGGTGNTLAKDLPLFIAFAVLAAYTYTSRPAGAGADRVPQGRPDLPGHRRRDHLPAAQARRLGPRSSTPRRRRWPTTNPATGKPTGAFIPSPAQSWAYATLALGSAMALFMYPHSITAVLSCKNRNVIRRNASILPAYSFLLGLLALLGFVAIAAGTKPIGLDGKPNPQLVDPAALRGQVPVAGSPASPSRRSPSARSCRPRSCPSRRPTCSPATSTATCSSRTPRRAQEAQVSKLVSLVVKFGALLFVLFLDKQNAINFQLLGGIWILQTFPAIVFGLYTRWFHRWALLAGWAVAMVYGTSTAYDVVNPATGKHFGGSTATSRSSARSATSRSPRSSINLVVAAVVTLVLRAAKAPAGVDETTPGDYHADAGDPRVRPIPELTESV